MKKLGLLLIACFSFTLVSVAQNNIVKSLERNVPGQGKVSIHQDARIEALIGSEYIPTYSVASDIKERFPDLPVYTSFNPPRWLCRAGDFRSIEEADAMMRQLRATGVFKEVSIVKDQINIPL